MSYACNSIERGKILLIYSAVTALVACTTMGPVTSEVGTELGNGAQVDLRVAAAQSPNEIYQQQRSFQVPESHKVGDKLFPYEGIGWENELVGYRLYLDERAVTDIFGKKAPDLVLDQIDYRSRYHDLADWGMDVLKVGPSLGIGGLGLYRNGELQRFGAEGTLSVEVNQQSGSEVSFTLSHARIPVTDELFGSVDATYSLRTGSPLTWVEVKSDLPAATLATGLVATPDGKRLRNSNQVKKGDWNYIASWGDTRSEVKDGLGMALFYREREARLMPKEKDTYALRFNTPNPTYAFAAVWEQGPMGISSEEEFIAWADQQQSDLNN